MNAKHKFNRGKNNVYKAESLLELLTKRGVIKPAGIKNRTDLRIRKNNIAYHNTKMLLKHYRNIIWQAECEIDIIAEELNLPLHNLDAVLNRIDAEIGMGNRRFEARLESLEKTRILIDRVNEALTLLKKKPDDGERLYNLIYLTYIIPEKLSLSDILYRLNLSTRHFYRLREQAIAVLSIRLWTAPTSELDIWIDLFEFLNQ